MEKALLSDPHNPHTPHTPLPGLYMVSMSSRVQNNDPPENCKGQLKNTNRCDQLFFFLYFASNAAALDPTDNAVLRS